MIIIRITFSMQRNMKVAVIGTVGIPAVYGGFETLVEYLTKYLGNQLDFTVYCSSRAYPSKMEVYNNSYLSYIPLKANGLQSIPYDIISLFKAARRNQTILILGVSGCIALPLFKMFYKESRLIVNIDGLEHKREKWSNLVRKFLKYSEKLAIKYGDEIITDNKAIQKYVTDIYGRESIFIAYAGDQVRKLDLTEEVIKQYSLPSRYACSVCRIEPENNIQLIIEAFIEAKQSLVIIGNWEASSYGLMLRAMYMEKENIQLLNPIYDQDILNQIRSNCSVYIHGHSAGGTNPGLVEAMSLSLPIFTYDCVYNRETTLDKGFYFSNTLELKLLIQETTEDALKNVGSILFEVSKEMYTWRIISTQYYNLLVS